jgi:hypothetical protein
MPGPPQTPLKGAALFPFLSPSSSFVSAYFGSADPIQRQTGRGEMHVQSGCPWLASVPLRSRSPPIQIMYLMVFDTYLLFKYQREDERSTACNCHVHAATPPAGRLDQGPIVLHVSVSCYKACRPRSRTYRLILEDGASSYCVMRGVGGNRRAKNDVLAAGEGMAGDRVRKKRKGGVRVRTAARVSKPRLRAGGAWGKSAKRHGGVWGAAGIFLLRPTASRQVVAKMLASLSFAGLCVYVCALQGSKLTYHFLGSCHVCTYRATMTKRHMSRIISSRAPATGLDAPPPGKGDSFGGIGR